MTNKKSSTDKKYLTEEEVLKLIIANKEEKPKYKGWLTSESLLKRGFAVMGHFIMAYLTILLSSLILLLIAEIFR